MSRPCMPCLLEMFENVVAHNPITVVVDLHGSILVSIGKCTTQNDVQHLGVRERKRNTVCHYCVNAQIPFAPATAWVMKINNKNGGYILLRRLLV